MARICIVTPGQLGSNPRVVKEASALAEAGHEVTVICTKVADFVEPRDQAIIAGARFSVHRLAFGRTFSWYRARILQVVAGLLWRIGLGQRMADRAISAFTPALTSAACAWPADLYIAHYVAALPAAAAAAARSQTRYAFDAEDFHLGDLPDSAEHEREREIIRAIEQRYLPGAAYVTAASPLIAQTYAQAYAITEPTVILNLFPKAGRVRAKALLGNTTPLPSLYWFSQTIGPGRGLETAIRAIAIARSAPHLFLRGTPAMDYERELQSLATNLRVEDRIHFLKPVNPNELECSGSGFDLGYVGELDVTLNRRIALTNKLFSYLTSGIPIVASDIPAHRNIAGTFGQALRLFPLGNERALADAIDSYLCDTRFLAAAREHAWRLGQTTYCWERESRKLLCVMDKVGLAP